MRLRWRWGSKISEQLIEEGLCSVGNLFTGRLLDVGCGKKPYRQVLGDGVEQWIGLDVPTAASGRPSADVFGSALEMPFGSAAFDVVLSTQVLEHVPTPATLILEASRVLKPGGHLILTAPQTNPLHEEPHDYFRFTSHGLQFLVKNAGFDVVQLRPLGGAIATVGQLVVWHFGWLRRLPGVGPTMGDLANACIAWSVLKLDRFSFVYGGGAMKDTLNWLLVARKPR